MAKRGKVLVLEKVQTGSAVAWSPHKPDQKNNWLSSGLQTGYEQLCPLGFKRRKSETKGVEAVFEIYSNDNDASRDDWVYNFSRATLIKNTKLFAETYNAELDRWIRSGRPKEIDKFLIDDPTKIKWTRNAKRDLRLGRRVEFSEKQIRTAIYRPFSKRFLYTGKIFNKEVAQFGKILPTVETVSENRVLCIAGIGNRQAFGALAINAIPPLDIAFEKNQCFPFYTYAEDGTHHRENITDWALEQFRVRYDDRSITKWGIFHYIYAVLHHPEYRERYAANLRRELPRIPFASLTSCHPEAAESGAKRATPKEGSMHSAGRYWRCRRVHRSFGPQRTRASG